jgi:hypothetical protein
MIGLCIANNQVCSENDASCLIGKTSEETEPGSAGFFSNKYLLIYVLVIVLVLSSVLAFIIYVSHYSTPTGTLRFHGDYYRFQPLSLKVDASRIDIDGEDTIPIHLYFVFKTEKKQHLPIDQIPDILGRQANETSDILGRQALISLIKEEPAKDIPGTTEVKVRRLLSVEAGWIEEEKEVKTQNKDKEHTSDMKNENGDIVRRFSVKIDSRVINACIGDAQGSVDVGVILHENDPAIDDIPTSLKLEKLNIMPSPCDRVIEFRDQSLQVYVDTTRNIMAQKKKK